MRPQYVSNKMKRKAYKKKFGQKRFQFCGCPGIHTSDFDDINETLRVNKLQLSTGKGSWKVMPKDSCEVYKERRKRQINRKQRSNESENNSETPEKNDKRTKKPPRKAKHKYRSGQRRRHRRRSKSCSCCSSRSSYSCSTKTKQ